MSIDKTWHLAQSTEEIKVTEFEFQLWRVFYGFLRWQKECEHSANDTDLIGDELAILHVIRMKDKPKTTYDLARLLNRDDTFNINYIIRKLLKRGLIKKVPAQGSKKMLAYQITEAGIKNTDAYTSVRKSILINMFIKETELNLEEISKTLAKLKAIYDEADRAAASYAIPETTKEKKKNKQK